MSDDEAADHGEEGRYDQCRGEAVAGDGRRWQAVTGTRPESAGR